MQNNLEQPVRQAGSIYLKNVIINNWVDNETKSGGGGGGGGQQQQQIPFFIHEQDRGMIRGSIVDAVVHSPDLIRFVLFVLFVNQ